MSDRALRVASQSAIAAITLSAAAIACFPLPSLFSVTLFAFQIMVQLAVPLYFGIFTKLGGRWSALASMTSGIATVCMLQALYPLDIPWALGLTSGAVALGVNLAAFLVLALLPRSERERMRLEVSFAEVNRNEQRTSKLNL